MSKARIFGLGFGVLLIVAAFGLVLWQAGTMPITSTAYAQGGSTATPTAAATPAAGATTSPTQQTTNAIGDTFWTLLADKLGVDADELKQQAVETRQEMVDQAVTDGRTTQEQADAIKENITANNIIAPIQLNGPGRPGIPPMQPNQPNSQGQPRRGPFGWFGQGNGNGGFPGMGGFGGMFGRGMLGANLDVVTAVADALNMEPKALVEQFSQGQSLAEIAEAQGVDEATVKEAIITYFTGKIDEQLALGLISEVQANQLKSQLTPENIDLSRGLQFRFRLSPNDEDSSQLFPGMGFGHGFSLEPGNMQQLGQMFGLTPEQMQEFGQMFGQSGNVPWLNVDPSSIQTQ